MLDIPCDSEMQITELPLLVSQASVVPSFGRVPLIQYKTIGKEYFRALQDSGLLGNSIPWYRKNLDRYRSNRFKCSLPNVGEIRFSHILNNSPLFLLGKEVSVRKQAQLALTREMLRTPDLAIKLELAIENYHLGKATNTHREFSKLLIDLQRGKTQFAIKKLLDPVLVKTGSTPLRLVRFGDPGSPAKATPTNLTESISPPTIVESSEDDDDDWEVL